MTGEQLKNELTRIAEAAPEIHVPDDLFGRGRRATMRARVIAGAAAVACIGLIAAAGASLVVAGDAQVADDDRDIGVPDRIYAPVDGDVDDLPVTTIGDVGRVVAAYLVDTGEVDVVAITEEGRYVELRLPHYDVTAFDEVSPRLSPDGLQIAYTSRKDGEQTLGVADLRTGAVRQVALVEPYGATVRTMQWSPDGRWVVWSGQAVSELGGNGASYRSGIIAGVVEPGSSTSRGLPAAGIGGWDGVGICDDGTALTYVWPKFRIFDGDRPRLEKSWARATADHGSCTAPATYAHVDGAGSERLLGWLPGDEPTAVTIVRPDSQSTYDSLTIRLVEVDGSSRDVGKVESSWVDNVTIATGLMSADRPTVPAGANPWGRSWIVEHWLELLAGVVGAGLLVLVVVRARAVRR